MKLFRSRYAKRCEVFMLKPVMELRVISALLMHFGLAHEQLQFCEQNGCWKGSVLLLKLLRFPPNENKLATPFTQFAAYTTQNRKERVSNVNFCKEHTVITLLHSKFEVLSLDGKSKISDFLVIGKAKVNLRNPKLLMYLPRSLKKSYNQLKKRN